MNAPQNPFSEVSRSIQRDLPFARDQVVREIYNRLVGNPVQGAESFSLIGPRYIGKTFILQSLLNPEVKKRYLDDSSNLHLIYFDCVSLPISRKGVFELLGRQTVEGAHIRWGMTFEESLSSEYLSWLFDGSEVAQVKAGFEGLLKELASQYNRHVVFVLDNFEKLLALFTESDIQFMRDVFSNTKHALVVATPKHIREHSSKTFPSKFYEIFKTHRLRAFTRDQAYDYLTQMTSGSAREFSHSEKEQIMEKAGQHPHFLRVYAAEVWRRKLNQPAEQPIVSFQRVDHKVKPELDGSFLALWETLNKDFQTGLYQFAAKKIDAKDIIRTLQCLEEEYALVYRTPRGSFEMMGELLRDFVVSQTELIDHLLKTDFYRAGLKALEKVHETGYFDTDPQYYYQKAFQQFVASTPDYDSANAMLRDAFERLLDVMVKRAEPHVKRAFTGAGYKDKMQFIKSAFQIEDRIDRLLREFWNVTNESGPHPGRPANHYNTQLRLYILSGVIQYLLNAEIRSND